MEKINSIEALQNSIKRLEEKQITDRHNLNEQFVLIYESIKPINLLKSTIEQAANSQAIKGNLLNTGVGLAVGYLSRILVQQGTGGPIKSIIGTALQFGVTNIVSKNIGTIASLGTAIFRVIRRKKRESIPPEIESK
jgi:hypothetical protein